MIDKLSATASTAELTDPCTDDYQVPPDPCLDVTVRCGTLLCSQTFFPSWIKERKFKKKVVGRLVFINFNGMDVEAN